MRTRTVFSSNYEAVEAWALKGNEKARNQRKSIWADGNYLYSYGTHFILAVKVRDKDGDEFILVNGDRYSFTTSRHTWLVRDVVAGRKPYAVVSFSAIENLVQQFTDIEEIEYNKAGRVSWEEIVVIDKTEAKEEHIILHQESLNRVVITHPYSLREGEVREGRIEEVVSDIVRKKRQEYTEVIYKRTANSEAEIHCHTAETVLLKYRGITILAGFDDRSYFATAISEPVETIQEALDCLKPEIVRKAEAEGKEVLRQGEWFFVRVADLPQEVGLRNRDFRQRALPRLIGQSPHICRIAISSDGRLYCTGLVSHGRKGHTPLRLNGVYLAVRNKEMISSTANHRVD